MCSPSSIFHIPCGFLIHEETYHTLILGIISQQIGAMSMEKMSSTKYEIEKFTGMNDFGLWRLKMESLFVQQGLLEALKGSEKMDVALTTKEKTTMIEKA